MARKIKLPLDMGNDIKVRDIDELKENYNSEKVVEYFLSGELLTWLNDRFYDEEADGVEALSADSENIAGRLAEIFGVHIEGEVDVDEIAERKERLEKLRKITSDDDILRNVDLVAFSQEDMDIVHESDVIYLCGEKFRIPYSAQGKTYIGVNKPIVDISSSGEIDLKSRHIVLKNCILSESARSRMKATVTEKSKPDNERISPKPKPAKEKISSKPKPAPKLGGGLNFDLSEIEKMAKAIEAEAARNSHYDYDGSIDPKKVKLSDMG